MRNFRIINADVLDGLGQLADESVHMVCTSPPYFGLRNYGVDGQIGLEETFDEWLGKMVEVFKEVRRVLRPDGTLWLNIGDAYAQKGGQRFSQKEADSAIKRGKEYRYENQPAGWTGRGDRAANTAGGNLKPKDLIGQPWALAFALRDDGWWLRSDIIWQKPNPMPESCTDRPTKSHEHIFLLTPSARYFYDNEAVREKYSDKTTWEPYKVKNQKDVAGTKAQPPGSTKANIRRLGPNPAGRNLRDVWTFPTRSCSYAHYATFPEELPRKCIMAGTSERGVCPECGGPRVRVIEASGGALGKSFTDHKHDSTQGAATTKEFSKKGSDGTYKRKTIGFRPSCDCGGEPIPATVLDCFSGTSTTGFVALNLGRSYIGIEINPNDCEYSRARLEKAARQQLLF